MAKPRSQRQRPAARRSGHIRIISGRWRGRKLPVQDVEGLRPTTDRVKETVFNWLSGWLPGSRCLDPFAGSGSLAFEALSRGAASVLMLERDKAAAEQLKQNLALLGVDAQGHLEQTDSLRYLRQVPAHPFDLVFLDPPFRQGLLAQTAQLLESGGWLTDEALIYVETETELGEPALPTS